jgi:hypothetical protein
MPANAGETICCHDTNAQQSYGHDGQGHRTVKSTPWCLYTLTAYAAATAMLLSRQKPWEPWGSLAQVTTPTGPAWCPGGRTAQNAFCTCMRHTYIDQAQPSTTCHLLHGVTITIWLPVWSHEGIAFRGQGPHALLPCGSARYHKRASQHQAALTAPGHP